MLTFLIVIFAMLAIVIYAIGLYNGLVSDRNRFKNAFAQIDVQLERRYELIPNLVETAKGYLKHERETLEAVIAARNQAQAAAHMAAQRPTDVQAIKALGEAEGALGAALSRFFARQEEARKKTGLFIFYLLLAMVLIVLGINAGAFCAAALGGSYTEDFASWLREPQAILFAAGTLFVIVAGSTWQLIALSGGGQSVADMVGAEPIDPGTTDENERRLINIAEEMAIASGIPVPSLYVLEGEHGINAFVAGYGLTEAVMVVTRGALEKLNRDELQGVVGHEFSHILNGDMRINIRLMAILAGILLIGKLGGSLCDRYRAGK